MNVALSFYLMELKKIISYRAEFWLGFAGNVLSQFGVAFFLWKAIFAARGGESIQGYTFGGLMLYYLLVPLVERVVHGQEMGYVSAEIYDGSLSRYLIYPVSYFRIKYLGHLAQATVFLVQLFLGLALFLAVFHAPFSLSWQALARTLPVLLCSGLLFFIVTVNLEMLAFWADNVWSISVLHRLASHLLGGGLIPLAFFPGWAQTLLDWLPFTRMVSFPIRCLLGQVGNAEWIRGLGLTLMWAWLFALSGALLWRKGLKGYNGVGI
ncbi:MAG TPA: ABC-2 family transporter protein [Fibrobacteria bacterium]|nr:ABC-2 family transporter protein [Fibrobacteria bacterium]